MTDHAHHGHLHEFGTNCMAFVKNLITHAVHRGGHHPQGGAPHEIYQTSMISALLEGVYEGTMTYGELAAHGDFGLGTFNDLDGEMVALDGQFHQLLSDGTARPVSPDQRTPFAALIFFKPEKIAVIDQAQSQSQVFDQLKTLAPAENLFYAIRLDGLFRRVVTRTVPRQTKPYIPFTEIAKTQPVQQFDNVGGTLIGFRSPDYAQGIAVAGYHLHFITDDRQRGGHVLDFDLLRGSLQLDHSSNLHVELPETAAFLKADLHRPDQDAAIKAVEG